MRIIGLDPGLRKTGWGIIDHSGSSLTYVGDGVIKTSDKAPLATRLADLADSLTHIIEHFKPDHAAVEKVFVNKNPDSTLKLGMARGVILMIPAKLSLDVGEYPANLVKKSVVGSGHADKEQVTTMIKMLLPKAQLQTDDAADALAVAICHAHHAQTRELVGGVMAGSWGG